MEVKSEFFNGRLSLSFQLDKDDISKNRNSNIKMNHGIEEKMLQIFVISYYGKEILFLKV